MIKDNSEKQSVKTDEFEGMVQTNFETVVIGSVCGFLFFAELDVDTDTDTSESTTKVKYLVPDIDFDVDQYKIQWLPYSGKHQNAPFN